MFQVIPCSERPIIVDTKVKYIPEGQYKDSNAKNSNNNKKEKKPNKTRTATETPRKLENFINSLIGV